MSGTLNIISTNVQGYGPSETSFFPCFGVSLRSVSISPCGRSEFKSSQVKIISVKRSLKHTPFVCRAGSDGGQRSNPDFSRQNRHSFSRNRNRYNEERDSSENLDESEFISTKNGPIVSLSNGPKSNPTAAPGQREREIVELFRKVQTKLRERAAVKEEKNGETVEGKSKESETTGSIIELLNKFHTKAKREVNGNNASKFSVDRPKQSGSGKLDKDKSRNFLRSSLIAKEEREETQKPSIGRPVSNFKRRSPVPRVKYEPIISPKNAHDTVTQSVNGAYYEPVPDFESESESDLDIESGLELEREDEQEEEPEIELEPEPVPDFESESESDLDSDLDIESGLELEQEDEQEEAPEIELEPESKFVGEENVYDEKKDVYDEEDTEREHTEPKDLNGMMLPELRAIAKARGMTRYSKLKKSELIALLSDDSIVR